MVDRRQRHLVLRDAVDHRVGDAHGQRRPGGDVLVVLQALVALDAALDLVLRLALAPSELDAVDAAIAGVDQIEIVDEAAEKAGAAGRVGPDAIALQREVLLVGLRARARRARWRSKARRRESRCAECFERWACVGSGSVGVRRDGARHAPMARSTRAARPFGSAMRKTRISTPSSTCWLRSSVPESKRPPSSALPSRDSRIGVVTMRAAPRNAPRIEARPPMMMMKRSWNERSRSKPAGSTVRR